MKKPSKRASIATGRAEEPRLPFDRPGVPSIEDQIHRRFQNREEQRCLALEAQKRAQGKTGEEAEVERREVPKPWVRLGEGLCPPEFQEVVTAFDYKLDAPGFEEYCRSRGVAHVIGLDRRRALMADHQRTENAFMSDAYFRSAEPDEGRKGYRFSDAEMETQWRIVMLGRAALQDCWELFRARRDA